MRRMPWDAPWSGVCLVCAGWCVLGGPFSVAGAASFDSRDLRQTRMHGSHEPVGRKPELLVENRAGRAGAVVVDAHHLAVVADEVAPAHGHRSLDGCANQDVGR